MHERTSYADETVVTSGASAWAFDKKQKHSGYAPTVTFLTWHKENHKRS